MIRVNQNGETEIALINIFTSIQGESYASGKPTTFIRTHGCNLRCKFPCDTTECWTLELFKKIYPEREDLYWYTAKRIFDTVDEMEKGWRHKSICLTGGEPLMEENKSFMLNELLPLFMDAHYDVGIETDGAVDYTEYKERFGNSRIINAYGDREGLTIVADYKLPCSGMTHKMIKSNFGLYSETDVVKMVISDMDEDWEELDWVVNESGTKAAFFISPCFGKVTLSRIPDYVMSHPDKNITAQIQVHKVFWSPTKKDC